ncbi:outermembrane autotransporter (plasmid) [Zymomonas mobilis subsp. mobilis ZM4 = ATCC 31821]|nr:outermembrane autotransporter [Zymomonas mobilis subsp. mobilis]AVZ28769.1 outermembrane autotransporter [Zymomonas mobilis subsp. mobilis]AVZ43262.1 outermembrane autotransporter [Zymomonas mobilis subsp. mobilis ZM4 = ATCC 31821]
MKKFKNTLFNVNLTKKSLKISLLSASCLALFIPVAGFAQCTTSGNSVTCSGTVGDTTTSQTNYTAQIGTGKNSSINSVTINPNASVSYQRTVISLGSGSSSNHNSITIGGSVISGGLGSGPNGTGGNAVEFGNNTDLTIAKGGLIQVNSTGAYNAEAINPTGSGNIITNYGTIKTNSNASALWMEGTDTSVKTNGINTVDNYGLIQATPSGTGTIIGNSNSGIVYFTNRSGATVNGNISLGSTGNLANVVTFENGSKVNGTVSGGGNAATLNLTGASGSDSLSKSVSGFGTLNKSGNGTWSVGSAEAPLSSLSDSLHINVGKDPSGNTTDGGTLILAGDVSSKNAVIGIDNGTLQLGTGSTSGWVDGITHNNGTLVFNRSDTNTLSSNIDGVGQVQQIGSGTTILTGTNTYTGVTTISNGALQLGDGTTSGTITNSSAITNNANLTINNPANTTLSQVISGTGSLTQVGSGTTTLSGTNTYTGVTTISNGTLQLGDGTTSGTITNSSAITNNANLTINNPTNTTLSQIISGTGSLTQAGSGTTTLAGANTYTGQTTVAQNATLNLPGAVAGNLVNAGTTNVNGGTVGGITSNTGTLNAQNAALQDINNTAGTTSLNNSTAGSITNASNATFSAIGGIIHSVDNSGTMTLGTGNTVVGNVTNNDGSLTLGKGNYVIGNVTNSKGSLTLDGNVIVGTLAANGGSFEVTSANSGLNSLAGTANGNLDGTLKIYDAQDTYSGSMTGQGGVQLLGGTETLSGTNTYTGQTTVALNATLNLPGAVAGDLVNAGTTNVNGGTVGGITSNTGTLNAQNAALHDINNTAGTTSLNNSTAGTVTNASNATFSAVGGSLASATNSGTMTLGNGNNVAGDVTNNDGSLTLDGNAVAGTLAANGGSFEVTSANSDLGSLAGSANGNLDGALNLHNAKDTYSGAISGQGSLNILGGTETLSGTNTYTGQTTIAENATLQLGNGETSGTINNTQDIINHGTLSVNNSHAVTMPMLISSSGQFKQIGIGTTTLGDHNSYSGGTTITSGRLVGSAHSFGTGAINNYSALIIAQPSNATFDNSINGTGTLTKTGAGILTINSNNSLSGSTFLNQGELAVNGSLASSSVTSQPGTILSGTGTVGGITAKAGSIIRPAGNIIGTLNVSGNYQQDAGATYAVQVLPGTNTSDVLSINGKASLSDGAILSVSKASPGNYTLETKYRVLTTKGGVSGNYTLTGDTALSAFYGLGTTYDANNVYLEVKQDHLFVEEGKTSNQIAVAGGLDSLASNSVIKNVVGSLMTGDQARQAFNTLSGEIHASARTSLFQDSFYIRDITVERLRASDCGIGTDADTKKTCDIKKKREAEGACEGAAPALWMQSYGSWGRNSGNDNVATMNHSTGGFVLGADTPIGRSKWHIGGLFGYGYSSFNIPNRSSTGHSNNLTAGAYGGTSWGNLGFRMGASYTWNILSTNRTATIGQFSNQLNGHYNGDTAQVFGDLGYRFDVGNASLEPFANVAYVNLHTDSYHEHGGEAALHGKAIDTGLTYTTFGLRAAATLQKGDTAWIPNITVAYRHAFGDVDPTVTQRFIAGGNDFSVAGVPLSENSALVNAGFKVKAGKRITGGISYIGQYGDHYLSNGLRGTFSWIF